MEAFPSYWITGGRNAKVTPETCFGRPDFFVSASRVSSCQCLLPARFVEQFVILQLHKGRKLNNDNEVCQRLICPAGGAGACQRGAALCVDRCACHYPSYSRIRGHQRLGHRQRESVS